MVNKIGNSHSLRFWVVVHIILGIMCTTTSSALILWVYVVFFISIFQIFRKSAAEKWVYLSFFIAYLSSLELLGRMVQASPIVPWELSKYIMIPFSLLGMISKSKNQKYGYWLLILLVPAFFINESQQSIGFLYIVFSGFGPIALSLAVIYFNRLTFTEDLFKQLLRILTYPLVSVLTFTFLRTPEFDDINFNLSANFETSGGFGSNQVSTALGLGMFLMFVFWSNRWKFSGFNWLDIIFLIGFALQGLLTFSRGGMMGGVLGILVVLVVLNRSKVVPWLKGRIRLINRYALAGLVLITLVFFYTDNLSGGLLLKRYQGETMGTILGVKEKSLSTLTTGRWDIFIGDLALWGEFPILGTGVGASQDMRSTLNGVVAHVELSRLMAEHGILGLIFFILLVLLVFQIFKSRNDTIVKAVLISFLVISIFTTFHAATRTYISPLLAGLSLIVVSKSSRVFPLKGVIKYD